MSQAASHTSEAGFRKNWHTAAIGVFPGSWRAGRGNRSTDLRKICRADIKLSSDSIRIFTGPHIPPLRFADCYFPAIGFLRTAEIVLELIHTPPFKYARPKAERFLRRTQASAATSHWRNPLCSRFRLNANDVSSTKEGILAIKEAFQCIY